MRGTRPGGLTMFKPVTSDFYEAAVADHEFAAIQCADPIMREVWLATAAEWRVVSLTRPTPRRVRKVKPAPMSRRPRNSVGDVLVFSSAITTTVAAAVAPEFRRRELNELLAGQLIVDMHEVGAEAIVLHDAAALDAAAMSVTPALDVHDLIV